ncbi:F-box domain, Leucine-rich repeat domain, L domain-like protein [Artemisia annua]|uniref:F-box domain, Leucine-rich repeat domain, L domain-like protein n=1 Tax=Artemisia annua TaxID=35608 RepID=A0A2U1M7U0_ARTAN|nr:F-box domain, Leucine-rich repeat domain, L domain-like protein [Artemisia annua]
MDYRHAKTRLNVQGDRLSNLPDDLIHKILSFVGIKLAVQTSALSSRWRSLWTSLPCLNFSSSDFKTMAKFNKFVTHVLSHHNNQIEVTSAKLSFHGKVSQGFVRRILDYAISHNVQQLTVSSSDDSGTPFPLYLFSSQSLKCLTIAGTGSMRSPRFMATLELATLTTLHLEYITFNDEATDKCTGIFSKCANLKKLVLKQCSMNKSNGVDICHPGLSDLTLESKSLYKNVLNVVTPQLKNLTIRYCQEVHLSCAPELVSLIFEGSESDWVQFSSCGLRSLERVDLCISKPYYSDKLNMTDAHKFFDQLQQLHNAKHLTLNLQIFQLLSELMELISYQPSPFAELKSLKAYPRGAYSKVQETIPNEVKKYFLDSSPSATFTMVSCEEMRALENATSSQMLMAKLWAKLEHEKVKLETYRAHMDRGNSPIESYEPNMHEQGNVRADNMQINKREKINEVNSYWKDLSDHIALGKAKTSDIIYELLDIKPLLTELPASKRAHIEASYSSLCAVAKTVMNEIMDCMKIQSDKEQSRLRSTFMNLL